MLFLALFIIELFSLFLFSRILTNSLAKIFYSFTKSHKATISFLAAIFLPGTIIHEIAHVLVAGAMLVPSHEIEFIPQVREGGVKLGSAQIEHSDPLRRSIIGIAPIIIGVASILGLLIYSQNLIFHNQMSIWGYPIITYILFVLSNTMFSSQKDLEGSLGITIIIFSFILSLYFLNFHQFFDFLAFFYQKFLAQTIQTASFFMLIPIGIDISIYLLSRLIIHRNLRYY